MAKIKDIHAHEIFSSSGSLTIETTVILDDGNIGRACVPGNDNESKYAAVNFVVPKQNQIQGKGILMAISNVQNIIAPKLVGKDAMQQQEIDAVLLDLDGTQNKSRLGASATLSVSIAAARAAAKSSALPFYSYVRRLVSQQSAELKLPVVITSLINGGNRAENLLDFKDFLIVPASSKTFRESLQIGISSQVILKNNLQATSLLPLYSIDGGFSLQLPNNEAVFDLLKKAFDASNFRLGYDVFLGIDAGANEFYSEEKYRIKDSSMPMNSDDLISFYTNLINKYHAFYFEDPLAEDDWEGWEKMSKQISGGTITVGDSLTATNPNRIQIAINKKVISGVVIKPIQIGTISEALVSINIARASGIKIIVSHQSGDALDDFLADFAVAVNADYVNFGPFTRGENVINYNRLLEIERDIVQV